ncbi:MAG: hypothetical protein CL843_09090 [Crocinitomicaceae bacterium]|nr:hypothetical protein [Crocinitomicaceae bacterium]|tara:strand:- start:1455 stop:2039 length:585 start_codon:yes stop_codon:yes gene_type:complete
MNNILIVDDHEIYANTLSSILKTHNLNCYTAHSYNEANDLLVSFDIQLALIDVNLDDNKNGFHVAELARSINADIKIVMMSFMHSFSFTKKLETLKPNGVIHKDDKRFINAVKEVLEGKEYFNYAHSGKLNKLSAREMEIAELILADKSSNDISFLLNVSSETVRSYRKNIYTKLGVNSVVGLTKLFYSNGNEF